MKHETKHHSNTNTLLFLIITATLTLHTSALPLPSFITSNKQIILQSSPDSVPTSATTTTTTSRFNFIATQTHLAMLPELAHDNEEPLSDPFAAISLTSLKSPGKGRPGRPGRPSHADVHGQGMGRTMVWNPWTWRSELRRGAGCGAWRAARKVGKEVRVEPRIGNGEELDEEGVKEKEEVKAKAKVEVVEEASISKAEAKEEQTISDTKPVTSVFDAILDEELFTTSATTSKPAAAEPAPAPAPQTTTSDAPEKALITSSQPEHEPSQTQLDQSAFASGLGGHLVAFERVPMVEFVKAEE